MILQLLSFSNAIVSIKSKQFNSSQRRSEFATAKRQTSSSFFGSNSQFFTDTTEAIASSDEASVIAEITAYTKLKNLELDENLLDFWKLNEKSFPILAKLATRYLSSPAISVASEQLFSVARDVNDYADQVLSPGQRREAHILNKCLIN
uniref:HAT C-terminal dimerisation domain-containing protein n=1 Tax=Ditylenchus dipsaci TaxID=166011 RepID=A0A915EPS8_9BILA